MENQKQIKTNYILVDYENVQPLSFKIPENYFFKIILFVGANQTKIPIELATSMQHMGCNAEYVRIDGSGKNALDFHITFYLGKLFENDKNGYFHLISKDTGFDILIQHLKKQRVLINRYDSINDILAFKIDNSKKLGTVEQVKFVVDYLIKRGNAKPRKIETLSNTINSLFLKVLTAQEISLIIKYMVEKKLIIINDTKITYTLK